MKTFLKIAFVICFSVFGVTVYFYRAAETRAQTEPSVPYLSANQQKDEFPTKLNLDCAGCHGPGKSLPKMGSEKFHKDAHDAYDQSIHGRIGAASCKACHTINGDMTTALPAANPKSTVNRANLPQTCGTCHQNALTSFHLSIHGSRSDQGNTKAATCADCHGSHSILAVKDINSTLSRPNTATTVCIKCHSQEVADYESSSHGKALMSGIAKAPNCTDCHTAVSHLKAPLSLPRFQHVDGREVQPVSRIASSELPRYIPRSIVGIRVQARGNMCRLPHAAQQPSGERSPVIGQSGESGPDMLKVPYGRKREFCSL